MKKLTVVTCSKSYHQALYVDGDLVESDSSLYANELASHAGTDPVLIESYNASFQEDWDDRFPKDLSEVEPFFE